ncbi:MAG: hypothetical protein NVSMB9_03470 [Isosphaeraceae bacterium]
MSARLIPLMMTGSTPVILLQRPVILIGRHPECDVRIDLSKVSRRHCCLALVYDRVVIRDLGSRNGLRINGLPVQEADLHVGDELAIGPLLFRYQASDKTPQSPPPPPASSKQPSPSNPPSLPFLPARQDNLEDDLIPLDF